MQKSLICTAAIVATLGLGAAANAAIVFDNFEINEGHFTGDPKTSSGTSTVLTPASTANRTTAVGEVFEGVGAEKMVLAAPASGTVRSRFLSGATTLGAPAGQTSFSVSNATTDGYIGFYYKVIGSGNGLQFGLNLDDPTNTGGNMVGGILKTAVADNDWHVVEWNLDLLSDWGAVAGVGGIAANLEAAGDNPHTIDSIYFYNMALNSTTTVVFDFVALNPDGHIADLVPEPASMSLMGLGALAAIARRRRA